MSRLRVVKVRSPFTRQKVPAIFDQADFLGAVVADVGAGYGAKGEYAVRRGARYAVLIDVDETALRERDGLGLDRVVADAHMLPLRDRSADVVIFWNVLQFLHDEERALAEVARTARRLILFSVYNAASGRRYTWSEFLERARKLGTPIHWRRGYAQHQAVVVL
ncbi:MAG: class I SAM-dependent methyltransferase [Thermoproteus sp.]